MPIRFLVLLLPMLIAAPALAGPGHDHGDHGDGPPLAAKPIPRLESTGSTLELVAVAKGHKLSIYLADVETNAPIEGASIEVSGDGFAMQTAQETGGGEYEVATEWLEEPGPKALTFVIMTGDDADLLNGVLHIPDHEAETASQPLCAADLMARPGVWVIAALFALLGFIFAFAFRPVRLPRVSAYETEPEGVEAGAGPRLDVLRGKRKAARVAAVAVGVIAVGLTVALAGPGHDHGGGHQDTAMAGVDTPRKRQAGDVFVPKHSQNLLKIRTQIAESTEAQASTDLVGTVISDPSFQGLLQAPMDGQIELAEEKVAFVGQRVKRGDVLAKLAPSMPVFERGALDQLAADVAGKLRIAEARLERLLGVREGFVAQREIDDTRKEIASLKEQRRVTEAKSAELLLLEAPVDGVISVANVRPGQVVSAKDTLFEIVDPEQLWVEAVGHGASDAYVNVTSAQAIDSEGRPVELSYLAQAPALRQQARPLYFRVSDPNSNFPIGAAVKVLVRHGEPEEGIVIPRTALVRAANGLHQVWAKTGPEEFEPVPVTSRPLDGDNILVSAGLNRGNRVVVEGAELLNQVR